MRVGVNTLFLIPGEVGGSETYLCGALGALVRGHPETELVLFTNEENDGFLRGRFGAAPNAAFAKLALRASNRYARILAEQFGLPGAVRRSGVDVLWSPGYTSPYFCACPQVVSVLDLQYKSHPEDLKPLARWVTHALVTASCRRARVLTTLSEFSKADIIRHMNVEAGRIVPTPLAADPLFAECGGRPPVDGPYILCVANTYPHKDVPTLIDAFGRLAGEIPHRLVLVGKPRLGEPAVQAALGRLAEPGRVVRLDRVETGALAALYQACAVFAFPSRYEGFGLPVLEALTAGAPVVTTRSGSIPEVGGEVVRYFDAGDAAGLAGQIRAVLGMDGAERESWRARAVAHAREFTWDRTAEILLSAFKQALS